MTHTTKTTRHHGRLRSAYLTLIAAGALISTPQLALAGGQVPFRASFDTVFEAAVDFPLVHVYVAGTGRATHLGHTSIETTSEVINLLTNLGTAAFQLTAANGDTITMEANFSAPPTPTGSLLIGTWQITGGTGRFANASGSGSFDGWANYTGPTSGIGHFTMMGTISKPGRNRSRWPGRQCRRARH